MVIKKTKIIFLIFLFALAAGFTLFSQNIFADTERPLEIEYPEIAGEKPTTVQETLLPDFVKYLFNFSLIIVGLIAFAALVIGGFLYLISAGNPAALADAKDRILGALIGLVLLLCSWLILVTINPQLTIFYPIELESVSFYQGTTGTVTLFTEVATLPKATCAVLNGYPNCDDDNPCIAEGTKCFDIFKNGKKKCVYENKMININGSDDLNKLIFAKIEEPKKITIKWDNIADSLILYGNDYEVRVCGDSDFKECKILRNPTTDPAFCVDIDPLINDITTNNLGDGKLSSLEVTYIPKGARLYEEKNFGGIYQEFPAGINDYACYSSRNPITKSNDFSLIGDNRASSIEVGPGYWTVLCKESNGDCGWGAPGIVYDTHPEKTGYGDTDLSNNDVGNNAVSKICVIKFGVCGGALIIGDGKTDFIPRGERYQLGKHSIVPSNSLTEVYLYRGNCKIKIWENSGTGAQCREPDATEKCDCGHLNVLTGIYDDPDNTYGVPCETDDTCCGREWTSKSPENWDSHGPAPNYANAWLLLSTKDGSCKVAGGTGYDCDDPPDGFNDCFTKNTDCTKYKYTFSDLECYYYTIGNCCGNITYTTCSNDACCKANEDCCKACNPINSVDKKASCVQVIE